jgi:hypothetical protein
MRRQALFLALLLGLRSRGVAQCPPLGPAVAELKAYLTYENGLGANKPKSESFSVLKIGDRVFFRLTRRPPEFARGDRPVYVYDPPERMRGSLTCPADATWVNCVGDWVRNPQGSSAVVTGDQKRHYSGEAPKEPTCEFRLEIPEWKPSPDDAEKKKLAADILQELRNFGYTDLKAVYIRDFNVADPDIWAYVISWSGESYFQGCSFDAKQSPHCYGWHLFGQTPLDSLKKQIMARPYRLYPPPIGKP